ncbi:MAG: glycosyltransferase family 39 protein [Candidatus Helarchaeota archaeon]
MSFGISNVLLLLFYYTHYFITYYLQITPTFSQYITIVFIGFLIIYLFTYYKKKESFLNNKIDSIETLKQFLLDKKYLIAILIFGGILRFGFMSNIDITGDEIFSLGISYPSIDFSILPVSAPPPFTCLSQHHPPLLSVNFYLTMNILNQNGWIYIEDWMAKFLPALIGLFTIIVVYIVVKKIYDERSALIAAFFFCICTFAVISNLVVFHEILLVPFAMICFLFAYEERWVLCGFFLGICFLIKISAYAMLPALLIYIIIKHFKFNIEQFKAVFGRIAKIAFIALLLYLPVIIYNLVLYIEFGYADSLYSRLFGLPEPITETIGDPEIPIGWTSGLFHFAWIILPELVNVLSVSTTVFLIFCIFLSFFDRGEKLKFNILLILFLLTIIFLFTYRWYQIVTLMIILVPLTILSSRISLILEKIKGLKAVTEKKKVTKRAIKNFAIYGILISIFGFNIFYTINTIAFNHSYYEMNDIDAVNNFQYTYSNVGYLWIPNNGYDELFNILNQYRNDLTVYVDDNHPIFSYIYYFYLKDITNLVSKWNYQNNCLFIIYKSSITIWETRFGTRDIIKTEYIQANCTLLANLTNFLIYIN